MTGYHVSSTAFRRLTLASAIALGLIVATGGAVRLTGSGLGCSSWPQCEPGELVPPLGMHAWVEFGNRLVTVAVTVVVGLTAAAAMRHEQRRRDLTLLSWGLVVGVLGQAVVGGLSVIYDLLPGWVMAHFLLSMLVLWDALVLHHRAAPGWQPPTAPVVRREVVWLGRGLASAAGVVLALGTVVTGTGPHAGDAKTSRLPFDLRDVTQLHADAALLLTGLAVATLVAMRIAEVPAHVARRGRWLVAAILLQVAIGYAQYFSGLPTGVVELHIAGATVLWTVTVWLNLGFTTSVPAAVLVPEPVREHAPRAFRRRVGAASDRLTPTPPR